MAQWTTTFAWVLAAGILGWLVYASFLRATDSLGRGEVRMGLVSWPLWPARWIIVIGLAAFLLVAVVNIVRLVRGEHLMGEGDEV